MEYGLIVTVLCLAVVFGLLAFLIFALYVMQFFTARKANQNVIIAEEKTQDTDFNQAVDDKAVIAAITAAIQIVLGGQTEEKKAKFIVRSIKRIN